MFKHVFGTLKQSRTVGTVLANTRHINPINEIPTTFVYQTLDRFEGNAMMTAARFGNHEVVPLLAAGGSSRTPGWTEPAELWL